MSFEYQLSITGKLYNLDCFYQVQCIISFFPPICRCQQAGDSIAPAPSNSLQPDDALGSMGMTRSTTSSPVPPSAQTTAWMSCRRMIYIKSSPPSGHWPVPESFWPDPSMQTLVIIFLHLKGLDLKGLGM